jgi:hypothetical protein
VVPEIRKSVEVWSANGRVAPVASMPKCDASRSTLISDCHDRAAVAHQFALSDRLPEAEAALDERRLARFPMLGPGGPAPPTRRENAWFLPHRPVHRVWKGSRLPRESTRSREEP